MSVIRLEDCTTDERRLLLALIANRKAADAAQKRTADAANAPTVLGDDREFTTSPRQRAA